MGPLCCHQRVSVLRIQSHTPSTTLRLQTVGHVHMHVTYCLRPMACRAVFLWAIATAACLKTDKEPTTTPQ